MNKIAVYPGTFDPVTRGHLDLMKRAAKVFDEVIVAVAISSTKKTLFTIDERVSLIREATADTPGISVESFDGLLINYLEAHHAHVILRGLRAISDFEYEFQMALMNRKLARSVETVFLMPALSWVYLSSTLLKDVAKNGGDVSTLAPAPVVAALKKKFAKK